MMDSTVDCIIQKLSQDQLDVWVERHREEKDSALRSGEAGGGGGEDKHECRTIAKKSKPFSRKNRSYLVNKTMSYAKEYLKCHKKAPGKRRKKGSIKAFLKTKPVEPRQSLLRPLFESAW